MHEAGLMETALELAAERARSAGATRVHRLKLRVGALSGVVPEALEFAFAALSPQGPAAGGVLEIESVPAAYRCEACGAEAVAECLPESCPRCGGGAPRLSRGLELELATLEVS
ncbi:MAG: hydrogenase maturation nickel metallochaperone HypA [Verrucomicrobiales bacterium]|nr:hydrogenase maturation nickel metallochaperone HypA [Verrucomicrobiales bacterium]